METLTKTGLRNLSESLYQIRSCLLLPVARYLPKLNIKALKDFLNF